MKMLGVGMIGSGIIVFYIMFFKLAPWISSLIPAGDWKPILKFVVYILVGYFGGVEILVGLIVGGFLLITGWMKS